MLPGVRHGPDDSAAFDRRVVAAGARLPPSQEWHAQPVRNGYHLEDCIEGYVNVLHRVPVHADAKYHSPRDERLQAKRARCTLATPKLL